MGYRYIDECSDCGQGLILIVKDKITNKLILICDDCESMWRSPELFYRNQGRISHDANVDLSKDVSIEEINSLGWQKYVKNINNPIDIYFMRIEKQ